jgi:hypothetical protein
LRPQYKLAQLTDANPANAARCFDERIEQAGVTVWRQQLQCFQPECADQDDGGNQKQAPGTGQSERSPDEGKRCEVLELRAGNDGSVA